MPKYTPKFKLPYLSNVGDAVTPDMEKVRYGTIDVQMDAICATIGDGVIAGWQVQATSPQDGSYENGSVWITSGRGFLGHVAGETTNARKVVNVVPGTAEAPATWYVHVSQNPFTTTTKDVNFFVSNTIFDNSQTLLLAKITSSGTDASSLVIDNSVRRAIGFTGALLAGLLAHKHGQNGISKIDLTSEVMGVLTGENISDIDASLITGGKISTDRFLLNHFDLLESGQISHSEIDSLIAFLQKANAKLFGDITTANLCQIASQAKQVIVDIDSKWRNMITVIAGLGTDQWKNTKSRFQPETQIPLDEYNAGHVSYVDTNSNTVYYNIDAAVVDYANHVIQGVPTSGVNILHYLVDNATQFDAARLASAVSVTGDSDSADVTLLTGHADSCLFDTSSSPLIATPSANHSINLLPSATYTSYPALWTAVTALPNTYNVDGTTHGPVLASTNPAWTLMERFTYSPGDGFSGGGDPPTMTDPKLYYFLDTTDSGKTGFFDWSEYESIQMTFSTDNATFHVDGNWIIELTDSDGTSTSAPFISAGDYPTSSPVVFDVRPFASIINMAEVAKIVIMPSSSPFVVTASTQDTPAISWASQIRQINLGGITLYSQQDVNNTLDRLYVVIPEGVTSNFRSLTWNAVEPGDSHVDIYLKTADTTAGHGADYTTLLLAANFGAVYSNSVTGRHSGATITEADGNCLEIEVILHPTSDGTQAPHLTSLNIEYDVPGSLNSISWGSSNSWDMESAELKNNVLYNSGLKISDTSAVNGFVFGQNGSFSFVDGSATVHQNTGSSMPLAQGQSEAGFSKICAAKIAGTGNIIIADTQNHRLASINRTTGQIEYVVAGSLAKNTPGAALSIKNAIFNEVTGILWINFSHAVDTGKIDMGLWRLVNGSLSRFVTRTNNTITINSNTTVGSTASGSATIGFVLADSDQEFVKSGLGAVSILPDLTNTTSSAATGQNLVSTTISAYPIYYRSDISYPIDIFLDSVDDLVIAQAVSSESVRGSSKVIKISQDNLAGDVIYRLDAANDGKSIIFGINGGGSVVERVSGSGDIELLVADFGNKRVLRVLSTGQILGTLNADAGLTPQGAVWNDDGTVTVAYASGEFSGCIKRYSSVFTLIDTYLENDISKPTDVTKITAQRIFVST